MVWCLHILQWEIQFFCFIDLMLMVYSYGKVSNIQIHISWNNGHPNIILLFFVLSVMVLSIRNLVPHCGCYFIFAAWQHGVWWGTCIDPKNPWFDTRVWRVTQVQYFFYLSLRACLSIYLYIGKEKYARQNWKWLIYWYSRSLALPDSSSLWAVQYLCFKYTLFSPYYNNN